MHEACVGSRAVPVGEARMEGEILDQLMLQRGQSGERQGKIGEAKLLIFGHQKYLT